MLEQPEKGHPKENTMDPPNEMPQLMSILNELLDGQDLTSLVNTGGNGGNLQDMVDQEENYEDESPQKDDPEELTRVLVQQRIEEKSRDQQQLQRKMDFLIRRLYKIVARATGLHASEEIAGFLEHVVRNNRKKENEFKEQNSPSNFLTPLTELPINLLSSPSASQEQAQPQNTPHSPVVVDSDIKESLKPVPISEMKSFFKNIEKVSTMQCTALNKRAHSIKYFTNPASNTLSSLSKSEANIFSNSIVRFDDKDIEQLDQVSGLLMNEMRWIEKQIDSDATASSSGGDSADEMVAYTNHFQRPLSISKRAAYRYAKDRGAVASRWCWLATQISELDYKIRQHTDLKKHIKNNKGVVTLLDQEGLESQPTEGKTSAYETDGDNEESVSSAARIRPLVIEQFRKRKLVQTANLHLSSKKAGRPSTLKCGCQWPLQPCTLCTGRVDPTAPRESPDVLPTAERVALLDPGFHPVLSFPDDVSNNIHLEAIMNITDWQAKMIRSSPKSIMKHAHKQLELLGAFNGENGVFKDSVKSHQTIDEKKVRKGNIDLLTGKRKYTKKHLKLDGVLASKFKERKKHKKRSGHPTMGSPSHVPRKYTFKKRIRKIGNDDMSRSSYCNYHPSLNEKPFDTYSRSKNSSPVPHHRSEKKHSESKSNRNYDIDNIVIPYSVAASTRVEVLSYKEIPTPKWRVVTEEVEQEQLSAEQEQCNQSGVGLEQEDISDESLVMKHDRALLEERKKFATYLKFPLTSRSRANRRIDSRGNESVDSGANTPTPDPTSPAPGNFGGDLESVPSPLNGPEQPSITALLNNLNGKKDRMRIQLKKDDCHDGFASGTVSRCSSPEPIKETVPAYEPLQFPLTEISLQRMKRIMPSDHLKRTNRYFNASSLTRIREVQSSTSHPMSLSRAPRPQKKRRHKDSISESRLIKEKLSSSSLTIGKTTNLLIPRNNPNALESIDLTASDDAVIKKLLINNSNLFNVEENDTDDYDDLNDGGSDSETITGEESLYDEIDTDEYTIDNDRI